MNWSIAALFAGITVMVLEQFEHGPYSTSVAVFFAAMFICGAIEDLKK